MMELIFNVMSPGKLRTFSLNFVNLNIHFLLCQCVQKKFIHKPVMLKLVSKVHQTSAILCRLPMLLICILLSANDTYSMYCRQPITLTL